MIEKETDVYKLHNKGDAQYLTFKRLDGFQELTHVFTTRHGGISSGCCESWNLGFNDRDPRENRWHNYGVLADVMGTTRGHMVWTNQTHTTNIKVVDESHRGIGITRDESFHDVDGLVTNSREVAIVTTHADCNPLFFYDPKLRVIGLAHSGWRGTHGRIGAKMVDLMKREYGSDAEDIICGIGPSLCRDCFEVDKDVADMFSSCDKRYIDLAYQKGIKYYIDLWAINRLILEDAGIAKDNIYCMGLCTKENMDMFFSHRGQHGQRGTMAACMMLR